MQRGKSVLFYLPIAIVLFFLAAWFIFSQMIFPALFTQYYDPEMAYLFSSLNLVKGQQIVYIDHPGTPVQILGAVLLLITYPLAKINGAAFVTYTLSNPYPFLFIAHGLVALLNGFTAFCVFKTFTRRKTPHEAVVGASLAVLYFFIHPNALYVTTFWSHNSFNFSAGALLLLLLYRISTRNTPARWFEILGLAFAAGVLTATTIYMACWIIGIALTLSLCALFRQEGLPRVLLLNVVFGIASAIGFVAATLPILPKYAQFFDWVMKLLIHQDRYGFGDVGWITLNQLTSRLSDLAKALPLLWIALAVFLVLAVRLVWMREKTQAGLSRLNGEHAFLIGIFFQFLINVLIIVKHPGIIYMLSAAATLAILVGAAVDLQNRRHPIAPKPAYLFGLVTLVLMGLAFFQSAQIFLNQRNRILQGEAFIQRELSTVAAEEGIPANDLRVLHTYGLYSPCFGLWFGNEYGGSTFNAAVSQICPRDYSYNIFNHNVSIVGAFNPNDWDVIISRENFLQRLPISDPSARKTPYLLGDAYGSLVIIRNLSAR